MKVGDGKSVSWAAFPQLEGEYEEFLLAQLPGDLSLLPRRKRQALAVMQGAAFAVRMQAYRAVTRLALGMLK